MRFNPRRLLFRLKYLAKCEYIHYNKSSFWSDFCEKCKKIKSFKNIKPFHFLKYLSTVRDNKTQWRINT